VNEFSGIDDEGGQASIRKSEVKRIKGVERTAHAGENDAPEVALVDLVSEAANFGGVDKGVERSPERPGLFQDVV